MTPQGWCCRWECRKLSQEPGSSGPPPHSKEAPRSGSICCIFPFSLKASDSPAPFIPKPVPPQEAVGDAGTKGLHPEEVRRVVNETHFFINRTALLTLPASLCSVNREMESR